MDSRVVVPVASGVCPLVGEVHPRACAGFLWEGQMPVLLWVELGLVPLMGRAVSRSVFQGCCELSMTLGNLSADGWGCVPVLLAVWLEAFQEPGTCRLLGGAGSSC